MPIFSQESLDTLRQRIDLVDVLSSHLDLKKAGAAYKGLCPFHDEKTPSFTIQKGDTHYHCFGCGAHGDAIQFLMSHLKLSFLDAIENLAQRFHVILERVEDSHEPQGPSKASQKEALEQACRFYHFILLHTPQGHQALSYLYNRGVDLDFIKSFQIGFAPASSGMLRSVLHKKSIKDEVMAEAGLVSHSKEGYWRDFFSDRITFPIRDPSGAVIGFSARKYKEETYGGKYVNTPETPLFKKSRVLFGFNYCRRRIAKERKVIIVEGQIDALRLIHAGLNFTVAGQGTAFGDGHVKELMALGINRVYLALDGDEAGLQAAIKIGNLFQKEGVEVFVVGLPAKSDPDTFLREYGVESFIKLLEVSIDYLSFAIQQKSRVVNIESPAGKNELIQEMIKMIRGWDHPLMVHESLRKLAQLTKVPEEIVGVGQEHLKNIYLKKSASVGQQVIDPDRIIESDLLRWLVLMGDTAPHFITLAKEHLKVEEFKVDVCRQAYQSYLTCYQEGKPLDLLSMIASMNTDAQNYFSELFQKKVNRERSEQHFLESIQKILDRNWMEAREVIKMKLQSGNCSDEEALDLVKEFDELKRNPPNIKSFAPLSKEK